MNAFLISIPIYILTFFFVSPADTSSTDFQLIKKGDGISFYERWITMKNGTKSREVKFTIEINAPTKNILEVLTKEEYGKKWNENTLDYKIKATENQSWISYIRYSFPFPLSDRECYLHNQLIETEQGSTILFRTEESRIFSKGEDLEQMTGLKGRWEIIDKKDHSLLRYHIISIPEKGLPRWIVDPIIRKNLWTTMETLKSTIEEI